MNIRILFATAAAIVLLGAHTSLAQQGTFGNRSVGTGSGLTGGQRTLGGGGRGQAGGMVPGATTQGTANIGQFTGNERFSRDARGPGQFVGGDSGDVRNFFSAVGGGGFQDFGPGAARRGDSQANAGRNERVTIPHRLQIALDGTGIPSGASPAPIDVVATESLTEVFKDRMPVTARVVGRTAILRGVVATDHQRDLAARVALLEAGISAVQNEITVAEPVDVPESPASEELAVPAAP